MATDALAYRRAACPLLPGMHAFSLTWDNSKSRKLDMDKLEKQDEMETRLGLAGSYTIDWSD